MTVPSGNRTPAQQADMPLNIDRVYTDEHNKPYFVVLAKQRIAPWWWFLREPKHVGASVIIL